MNDKFFSYELPCGCRSLLIREAAEILKEGGRIVVTNMCYDHTKYYLLGFTGEGQEMLMERDLLDKDAVSELLMTYINLKWPEKSIKIEGIPFKFKVAKSVDRYDKFVESLK